MESYCYRHPSPKEKFHGTSLFLFWPFRRYHSVMRLLALVLFALYLTGAVFAQEPADNFARLRVALNEGDHRSTAVELEAIKTSRPDIFASNDLDYLLGRTYERLGDTAGAIENFESARSRNSVVKDYALWHLASLARSSGNLFLERLYLNELTAFEAESLPAEAARIRYAES